MTLREELARWFMAVHHRWEHGMPLGPNTCPECAGLTKPKTSDPWYVMADEVIRQMEWAHQHCVDWDMEEPSALTLAPPDWKP